MAAQIGKNCCHADFSRSPEFTNHSGPSSSDAHAWSASSSVAWCSERTFPLEVWFDTLAGKNQLRLHALDYCVEVASHKGDVQSHRDLMCLECFSGHQRITDAFCD